MEHQYGGGDTLECVRFSPIQARIAKDRDPGSVVKIPFPVEPENYFNAKPSRDGYVHLQSPEEAQRNTQ